MALLAPLRRRLPGHGTDSDNAALAPTLAISGARSATAATRT